MDKGTARVRVEFINPYELPLQAETTQAAPPVSTDNNVNVPVNIADTSLIKTNTQPTPIEHQIYLQIAAFSQLTTAQELEQKLKSAIKATTKAPISINSSRSGFGENETQIHRVRIGPFKDELSAILVSEQIKHQKMGDPLIIHRQ